MNLFALNLIERHIALQILRYIFIVTFGFSLLVILIQSLQLFRLIINNGIDIVTFGSLLLLALPRLLSYALPLAVFISVVWFFWRMADDNELAVLRSAGLSDWSLLKAPILVSLFVSVLLYVLVLYVNPHARESFLRLQLSAKSEFSIGLIQAGRFNALNDHVTLYVKEIDDNFSVREIFLYDGRVDGEVGSRGQTIIADEGQLFESAEGFRLVARNGSHQVIRDGRLHSLSFDEYVVSLDADDERLLGRLKKASERPSIDLFMALFFDTNEVFSPAYKASLWSEFHNRVTYPLLAPLFCLWGCYNMLCCRRLFLPLGKVFLPVFNPMIFGFAGAFLIFFVDILLVNNIKRDIWNFWFLYLLFFAAIIFLMFLIARRSEESWVRIFDRLFRRLR